MAQLADRYPDDTEAAIFHALALNEAVDLNDKTYAKQFKAAAILQAITAQSPRHSALHHSQLRLRAHLPGRPIGGAALRRTSAGGAPCAPHALAYVFHAGD